MKEMIDWSFTPKPNSIKSSNEWHASVYYQPQKKSPSYTIQLHSNAPKKLLNADKVTFGVLGNKIVITNSDKGNGYTVHGKDGDATNSQINGKALVKQIASHFGCDNGKNKKMRFKFLPVGSESMSLWEINLHQID